MILGKEKINILGTKFHNVTRSEAVTYIVQALKEQKKASVFTPNPEVVMTAYRDQEVQDILNEAELVVADGIGIILGSKMIHRPLPERVAGYDLLQEIFKQIAHEPLTVFFFGAGKGVAQEAKLKMEAKYPGLSIVGTHHGYFDQDEDVVAAINQVKPDLVLVGLGAPKQEKWINQNKENIKASVLIGCGGSFDGMSGKVKRAPTFFVKFNLEWFYRLISQPSRAKRMLQLPVFVIKIFLEGKNYS